MKNLKQTSIAFIFALLANSFAFAGQGSSGNAAGNPYHEPFRVGMYRVKNSLSMNVLVEKHKNTRIYIKLLDGSGKVLHREFIGRGITKVGQKFDFSQISDGQYTIEVVSGDEKITKNISLATTELTEVAGRKLAALN